MALGRLPFGTAARFALGLSGLMLAAPRGRPVGLDRLPAGNAAGPRRRPDEVHHVVKRAQGGSDFDLDRLVALCPPCHGQTDAPYARGRLVITPVGAGRFTIAVIRGTDKWALGAHPTIVAGTSPEPATQPAVSREP